MGTTSSDQNINDLQIGSFTSTGSAPPSTDFSGHVIIGSSQTSVNHEMALMPFIGHSFINSYVYAGAGPALFGMQSKIYNATGFADINGTHVDITGMPTNFSSSQWEWGGAAQVGMDYFFDPSWFVDVNYTYAVSQRYSVNYSGPFSSFSDGYTTAGTLFVSNSQRAISQGVTVSINKSLG